MLNSLFVNPEFVTVRYIVDDVTSCIRFYTGLLGFELTMNPPGGFAMLTKGNLRLLLNEPGAGGAGRSMPDGVTPKPGGWNRIQLQTQDISKAIIDLTDVNTRFRNELVEGNGGKQILLEDPSGNLVELVEPRRK